MKNKVEYFIPTFVNEWTEDEARDFYNEIEKLEPMGVQAEYYSNDEIDWIISDLQEKGYTLDGLGAERVVGAYIEYDYNNHTITIIGFVYASGDWSNEEHLDIKKRTAKVVLEQNFLSGITVRSDIWFDFWDSCTPSCYSYQKLASLIGLKRLEEILSEFSWNDWKV